VEWISFVDMHQSLLQTQRRALTAYSQIRVIDQLTKAKSSLTSLTKSASLKKESMTAWRMFAISYALLSLSDLQSCLQHQNTYLWKCRYQQYIVFTWSVDPEENAMHQQQ
jgi:hypothetical protein